MNRSALTWNEVEDITRGRFGETSAVCPFCSAGRRTALKRKHKVLSVKLVEPDFAIFHCNHCEASGDCRPDRASRPVIDLAEQRRRREQAKRHTEAEKQDRTRRALELWDESLPFRGSPARSDGQPEQSRTLNRSVRLSRGWRLTRVGDNGSGDGKRANYSDDANSLRVLFLNQEMQPFCDIFGWRAGEGSGSDGFRLRLSSVRLSRARGWFGCSASLATVPSD